MTAQILSYLPPIRSTISATHARSTPWFCMGNYSSGAGLLVCGPRLGGPRQNELPGARMFRRWLAMKSVWDADARKDLLARFSRLKSDQKPVWGKMNAGQMVAHVTDPLRA